MLAEVVEVEVVSTPYLLLLTTRCYGIPRLGRCRCFLKEDAGKSVCACWHLLPYPRQYLRDTTEDTTEVSR